MDWIVTGASRGIGHALARRLAAGGAQGDRVFALARSGDLLERLAHDAGGAGELVPVHADLSSLADARRVGDDLASRLRPGAALVHNAGVWPTRPVLVDGLEAAFVTNCLGPLVLQQPLLRGGRVSRVLVVSAGLLVLGRFDAERTPAGKDFSVFRTYATTKLAGAAAMREAARGWPEVDFAVAHPGVADTELGARPGALGWLLKLLKRTLEAPDACAARMEGLLRSPRWESTPGDAPWYFEDSARPWPAAVERDTPAVLSAVRAALGADSLGGPAERRT